VNFLQIFVRRPVLAMVISMVIMLFGLQAAFNLSVRQYPETTSTTITVATPYIGANADLVRGFITSPLEQAISTAEGIDYVESTSSQGSSVINARLELGYPPNDAVAEILTKINQVQNQLPAQSENPVLTVRTGSDEAAMYIAFQSEALSREEITDYLNRAIRPRIETVSGVQQAAVQGGGSLAMRIWLDPDRLVSFGVTPGEVRTALASRNFLSALGSSKGSTLSIPIEADTNLTTPEAFDNLIVRQEGNAIIRLGDVADTMLGAETYDTSVKVDGDPVVFMAVEVAPTANVLTAVAQVRELFPELQLQLPDVIEAEIVYDATVAIESSINSVITSLFQALAIVTVVIFLFLGSIRSALVPAVTMPIALIGAFFLMQMLGFSINLLTLLALILAIGILVDDGIIVVENAVRLVEEGKSPQEAAKTTVRQLGKTIVAMNIVVLAVFAPIGFMGGLTGSLFTEFAYTVASATLLSGIVALTLSPMMCAKLLKQDQDKNRAAQFIETRFEKFAEGYQRVLVKTLDHARIMLIVGLAIIGSIYFLYSSSKSELEPPNDGGFLITSIQGDPNGSIDQLERWTDQLMASLGEVEGVERVFMIAGGGQPGSAASSAFGGIPLDDWSERDRTQQGLQGPLQRIAAGNPGLQAVVISPPSLPGSGGGSPVQFIISGVDEPRALLETSQRVLDAARASGLFVFVESDLKFDSLRSTVSVDRDKAAALGVDIDAVGTDLSTMLSGGFVNYFTFDGRSYRVIPQVERASRLTVDQLQDYQVRTRSGELVPVSTFVSIEESVQPRQLKRFNQLNSATISGVPAEGVALGEAITFLRKTAEEQLPASYTTDWAGRSRQFVGESSSLFVAFGLAVALMYLVLAAQYESFRDPAVMFMAVPMAIAGALIFFAAGVVTINIYTQIGLLALIGAIIRHGILLVEVANQQQDEQGLDRRKAMEEAARLRFRSIIMTTISTFVGVIPLIVAGSGPGAGSRFAISFTLGFGLVVGTLFTVFMVPAIYTLVARSRAGQAQAAS
jgi:multidrug efflux pump